MAPGVRCHPTHEAWNGSRRGLHSSPSWVFKLLMSPEAGDTGAPGEVPQTPMGRALFQLLVSVWESGVIPESWQSSVVVPLEKGGDVHDVGNLRGISLLSVALKILCMVVGSNLSSVVEEHQVLRREQAGFRKREECMGQVISLFEVLSRRRAAGRPSYVTFIDLKAAFDTVPHQALFARLRAVGVVGPTLRFIEGLYRTSSMRLRFPGGGLSDAFALLRGVRQGCPLSAILFDIFIDTLFDGWVDDDGISMAVEVPCVGSTSVSVPGLLFADDGVTISGNPPDLACALRRLSAWCDRWHMSANAKKCGILVVAQQCRTCKGVTGGFSAGGTGPAQGGPQCHLDLQEEVGRRLAGQLVLQGATVDFVNQYTYLGCVIDRSLSLDVMVVDRAAKGRRALMALQPFLRNNAVPLHVRATVFRGTVLQSCLYGAELWGGSLQRVRPVQRVVSSGLRLLVGCGLDSKLPAMFAVYRELSCPPVAAAALASRCRAFLKYSGLQTWIATLIARGPPVGLAKGSWVLSTKRLVSIHKAAQRLVPTVGSKGEKRQRLELLEDAVHRVLAAEWVALEGANKAAAARAYMEGQFVDTSLSRIGFSWVSIAGSSMVHLLRARVGAFVTDVRATHFADSDVDGVCRFCESGEKESLPHVLVQCPRWDPLRRGLLYSLLREGVELLHAHDPAIRASSVHLATLLLGGAVSGVRLTSWDRLPPGAALVDDAMSVASDDLSVVSSATAESQNGPQQFLFQKQGCYAVARFLERVSVLRRVVLVV